MSIVMRVFVVNQRCPTLCVTGTGRSLSLKLLQQLREQGASMSAKERAALAQGVSPGRVFREVQLQEPIRYGDCGVLWLL